MKLGKRFYSRVGSERWFFYFAFFARCFGLVISPLQDSPLDLDFWSIALSVGIQGKGKSREA